MNTVKICYSIRDNIGDAINPYIVERVLGYRAVHADVYHCDTSGIGSGLGRFFYRPEAYTALGKIKRELFRYLYNRPVFLWSSGFISTPTGKEKKARANIIPAAVRGRLSLEQVQKLMGKEYKDCVLGDAGILAAELLDKPVKKKYKLGIIPHDNERGHHMYDCIQQKNENSVIIDVRGDVFERIRLIAQCECIVSSSLHGLIIADGLHIPNRQVVLTDKLAGDGFKFADYYSAYGLSSDPIDLNKGIDFGLYDIYDNYHITSEMVESKKKELCQAFLNKA